MKTHKDAMILVVPFANVAPTIATTIQSIQSQTMGRFRCVLIDDASQDDTVARIQPLIASDDRFSLIQQPVRRGGALPNVVHGLSVMPVLDHTICVVIDGDDWLLHDQALATIQQVYNTTDAQLTYGNFVTHPQGQHGWVQPFPDWVIANNVYRCVYPFFMGPLRTFRGGLWAQLSMDWLRGPDGQFFTASGDCAMMVALAELAKGCMHCVTEPLYVVNRGAGHHVDMVRPNEQRRHAEWIRRMPTADASRQSAADRWASLTMDQWQSLLQLEQRMMAAFDAQGISFFPDSFDPHRHSDLYQQYQSALHKRPSPMA